jgi:uncharacterized protein
MPPPEGFEWDEVKNQLNIKNHHISFSRAAKIFSGDVLIEEDVRQDYGETRRIAIGRSEGRLLRVVYNPHGGNIRIISAKKADKDDRRDYYNAFLR